MILRATCRCSGDLPPPPICCMQAIELAPNFASAWFTLGEIREQLGEQRSRHHGVPQGARRRPGWIATAPACS